MVSVKVFGGAIGRRILLTVVCVGWTLAGLAAPQSLGGFPNMRDLGGWTGLGGHKVRTGQIYRSGGLNDNAKSKTVVDEQGVTNKVMKAGKARLTEAQRTMLVDTLGIRTDIDLRADWECWGMKGSPLGDKVEWAHLSIGAYHLTEVKKGANPTNTMHHRIFRLIMDPKKRPLDFHCIAGRDRTGTVAALTLAVLGVSEDDIVSDYLATPSCKPRDKWEPRIRKLIREKLMKRFPAETLAESAARYFVHIGFARADVEAFREQMLEPTRP